MILPYPEQVQSIKRFPLTLTLAALNVLLFVMIFSGANGELTSSVLLDQDGLILTGRLYHQYYAKLSPQEKSLRPEWMRNTNSDDSEHLGVLGAYALRDSRFVSVAGKMNFAGDQIQIQGWRKDFVQFRKKYQEQLLYKFGLSSSERKPFSWITYQFSHSTWMHLLSNLVFLIVMGMAVEGMVGGGGLLLLYMLGGIAGGAGFLWFDPQGTVPMVGASASISALLAFYCVAEARMRVRFLYLVSPMPGYYGAIYLPTLLMVPLFLVSDVANLWATPEGLGAGVAYAAHLGGAALGILFGALYRWQRPLHLYSHIVKYFS